MRAMVVSFSLTGQKNGYSAISWLHGWSSQKNPPWVRNENKIYMIGQTFTGFSFRNYENKDPLCIVSLGNLP